MKTLIWMLLTYSGCETKISTSSPPNKPNKFLPCYCIYKHTNIKIAKRSQIWVLLRGAWVSLLMTFVSTFILSILLMLAEQWPISDPPPIKKKNRKIFQYKFMHNHWILGVAEVHKSYRKKSRSHSNSWIIPWMSLYITFVNVDIVS